MISATVRKSSPRRTSVITVSADSLRFAGLSVFTYMWQLCFGSTLDRWSDDCSLLIKETVLCIKTKTILFCSFTAAHIL